MESHSEEEHPNFKRPRLNWRSEDMKNAIEAVESKDKTISAAAKMFNVPRKTLDDRVKGRVKHGSKPGVSTALTFVQEKSLVNYLLYMAERGFPLTRTMVKAFALAIAKRSGVAYRFNEELGPSDHWWQLFKRRHPVITLRKADSLERSRAEHLQEDITKEYFVKLESLLENGGIKNKPRRIYNCDETFLPLDCSREKVVAAKGSKVVYNQNIGTSEHITLLCCVSAAGFPMPPMIIYAKSFPGGQYRFDGPEDALYAKSDSGWIDSELFLAWLNKIFVKFCVPERPIMLLIDGHASHITIEAIDFCQANNIILFCLPPHTTHALQPLDVAVFKSLKDKFSKAVRSLSFTKKNFVVTKREFSKVLKSPFDHAFSIPNIKSGFSKCGIYPLNPNAIPQSKMKPSTLYGTSCVGHESTTSGVDDSSPCSTGSDIASTSDVAGQDTSTPFTSGQETSRLEQASASLPVIAGSSNFGTGLTMSPSTSSSSLTSINTSGTQLISSSTVSSSTTTCSSSLSSVNTPGIVNPLVSAGLVSPDLMDILAVPSADAAVSKQRTKRITGARCLTSDEYTEMLRKDKEKKEREEQDKIKRKEERERKRKEKEEKLKQKAGNSRGRRGGRGRGRGCRGGRGRGRGHLDAQESNESSSQTEAGDKDVDCGESQDTAIINDNEESTHQISSGTEDNEADNSDSDASGLSSRSQRVGRLRRRQHVPSRYRRHSGTDSDDNDGTLCCICKKNEPDGLAACVVFWVDCSKCGVWVHNQCAFNNNTASRKYLCKNCSK